MAMAAGHRVWFPQSVTHLILPSAWHKIPKILTLSVMFISLICVYECVCMLYVCMHFSLCVHMYVFIQFCAHG